MGEPSSDVSEVNAAKEFCSIVYDSWEIIKDEAAKSLSSYASLPQKHLLERIHISVVEIFATVCVLQSVWLIPAAIVFVIQRGRPLVKMAREFLSSESTVESLSRKWKEVQADYKKQLVDEITPNLIVAFAIDALFCIVVGLGTRSLYHVMRAAMVSGLVAYSLYALLIERCESAQKSRTPKARGKH
jgi:hypothetical protein